MSLFDTMKSPEGQGLLAMVAGGMMGARRGQPINTIGRSIISGLAGYGGARVLNRQELEDADQRKLRAAQINKFEAELQEKKDTASWWDQVKGAKTPGTTGQDAIPEWLSPIDSEVISEPLSGSQNIPFSSQFSGAEPVAPPDVTSSPLPGSQSNQFSGLQVPYAQDNVTPDTQPRTPRFGQADYQRNPMYDQMDADYKNETELANRAKANLAARPQIDAQPDTPIAKPDVQEPAFAGRVVTGRSVPGIPGTPAVPATPGGYDMGKVRELLLAQHSPYRVKAFEEMMGGGLGKEVIERLSAINIVPSLATPQQSLSAWR